MTATIEGKVCRRCSSRVRELNGWLWCPTCLRYVEEEQVRAINPGALLLGGLVAALLGAACAFFLRG